MQRCQESGPNSGWASWDVSKACKLRWRPPCKQPNTGVNFILNVRPLTGMVSPYHWPDPSQIYPSDAGFRCPVPPSSRSRGSRHIPSVRRASVPPVFAGTLHGARRHMGHEGVVPGLVACSAQLRGCHGAGLLRCSVDFLKDRLFNVDC